MFLRKIDTGDDLKGPCVIWLQFFKMLAVEQDLRHCEEFGDSKEALGCFLSTIEQLNGRKLLQKAG